MGAQYSSAVLRLRSRGFQDMQQRSAVLWQLGMRIGLLRHIRVRMRITVIWGKGLRSAILPYIKLYSAVI